MIFNNAFSLYELVIGCIALFNVVMTLAVLVGNRSKAAASKLADMQTDVEAKLDALGTEVRSAVGSHSVRLERLDATFARMPSHADLATLYEQVNAVRDKVSSVQGELRGINDNLRLITAKLLDDK